MILLFDLLNGGLLEGPWRGFGGVSRGIGAIWHWLGDHPFLPNGVLEWVVAYRGESNINVVFLGKPFQMLSEVISMLEIIKIGPEIGGKSSFL